MQDRKASGVLIAEDEALIAADLSDCVVQAGLRVVGPAATVAEALLLCARERFDAALLDRNLNGERIDEVAILLIQRSIPFAFVTGYAEEDVPAQFKDAPIIAKPFRLTQIEAVIATLLRKRAGGALVPPI